MYNIVDETLPTHPKTEIASAVLGITAPALIGHLMCLWLWAMKHAKDGDLSDYPHARIATAAMWRGDADTFIDALVTCAAKRGGMGFLERDDDGSLYIHDWEQYGGKLTDRLVKDAQRKRTERAAVRRTSTGQTADVLDSSQGIRLPSEGHPTDDSPIPDPCPMDVRGTSEGRTPDIQGTSVDKSRTSGPKQRQEEISKAKSNTGGAHTRAAPPVGDLPDVVALLASLGVAPDVVGHLCASFPEQDIRNQIEWLPYRKPDNPPAILVAAIKGRFKMPPAAAGAAQKAAENREIHSQLDARDAMKAQLDELIAASSEEDRASIEAEALEELALKPQSAQRGPARAGTLKLLRRLIAAERHGIDASIIDIDIPGGSRQGEQS